MGGKWVLVGEISDIVWENKGNIVSEAQKTRDTSSRGCSQLLFLNQSTT